MKLIELLVQELPELENVPTNWEFVFQDWDNELRFDGFHGPYLEILADDHRKRYTDGDNCKVTREQYEAALAATQQPVWNGEGLPPVGTECEVQYWNDGLCEKVKVIAYHNDQVWVEFVECNGKTALIGNPDFRPIRSEADKKRDEAIEGLAYYVGKEDATDLYAAIAIGNIKGVKLDV